MNEMSFQVNDYVYPPEQILPVLDIIMNRPHPQYVNRT